MAAEIRKTLLHVETTLIEGGKTAPRPLKLIAAAAIIFSGTGAVRPPSISVVSTFSSVLRMRAGMGGILQWRCSCMLVYHKTICQVFLAPRPSRG